MEELTFSKEMGEPIASNISSLTSRIENPESYKIIYSNDFYFNEIIEIINEHAYSLAEVLNLNQEDKKEFLKRFEEMFKNLMKDNVTKNDLPWVEQNNVLTFSQKEENELLIKEALLSKLGKILVVTTQKRKRYPEHCVKLLELKYKQDRENLRKSIQSENNEMPKLPLLSNFDYISLKKEIEEISTELKSIKKKAQVKTEQIKEIESNIEFAQDIINHQKCIMEALNED